MEAAARTSGRPLPSASGHWQGCPNRKSGAARGSAPEDAKGYVAVSIGGGEHWQGFQVTDDHRVADEGMLAMVREANVGAGSQPGTKVSSGLPSVSAEDQPVVGTLAAVPASLMDKGTAVPQPPAAQALAILEHVAAAAWALNSVTGERWLHVAASRDPRGGWRTQVRRCDAASLDEAREAIVADIRGRKAASRIAGEFMDNIERMAGQRREE